MKKFARLRATRAAQTASAGHSARNVERMRFWDEWTNTRSLTKDDLDFDSLRCVENDLEREVCLFYEYSRESAAELEMVERSRGDNPDMERTLAEGHAEAWGKHTFPDCLRGLCDEWPKTPWLTLPPVERKRIVNMLAHPLRDVPKFESDEIGFRGIPIFRTQHSFSGEDWKALDWFRKNPDWPCTFKLVRFRKNPSRDRIYAALTLNVNESPGKLGKQLEEWMAACVREAKIQQRDWRKGRKSARLEKFGLEGSPLDLLHALAAFRLHRRHKNFDKACQLSKLFTSKPIYANERKWQAAIRKARHTLQTVFPVPE